MTTSDPQAGRRDDPDGEHRTIGQRIRDAVLGDDPADRRATAGSEYADPDQERPHPGDTGETGRTRSTGYPDADTFDEAVHGAGSPAATHIRSDRLPEHARTGAAGTDARGADTVDTGHTDTVYADPGDTGYADPTARGSSADAGRSDLADPAPTDPVRDGGDPDDDTLPAGTAGTASGSFGPGTLDTGTAGATAGPAADPTRGDLDRDRGTHDYDPTADTGYVDERRAAVDDTTGDRDADYDTGRVDTRGDAGSGGAGTGGTGAAALAGGAAVAGAAHRSADEPRDRPGGFSAVDDTATVDDTGTGRATTDPDRPAGAPGASEAEQRAEAVAADDAAEGQGGRERLVPADRADDYGRRWDALKGDFVDEPRRAVGRADELVGELLDEIQRLFADQRRDLEQGLDHDSASTEDLRLALRRYRSFFDRLLSF